MASVVDTYELSPMQAGMLFHGLSGGDANAYIEQVVATLQQQLNAYRELSTSLSYENS